MRLLLNSVTTSADLSGKTDNSFMKIRRINPDALRPSGCRQAVTSEARDITSEYGTQYSNVAPSPGMYSPIDRLGNTGLKGSN